MTREREREKTDMVNEQFLTGAEIDVLSDPRKTRLKKITAKKRTRDKKCGENMKQQSHYLFFPL